MFTASLQPAENRLFAALPQAQWERWKPQLEIVELALGQVLYQSGDRRRQVYFPISAVISLLNEMNSGASADVAIVGREGLVGFSTYMGGDSTPSQAVVQCAGIVARVDAQVIQESFSESRSVMHLLLRFTQALMSQVAQTVVCTRHHSLDQQLCRWLLLCLDRIDGNQLVLTQERIAKMIGVRREGVTEASIKLQNMNLIRYSRGHIVILDRPGLERRSCECYRVVKHEYERLLCERTDDCRTISHRVVATARSSTATSSTARSSTAIGC